MNNEKYEIFRNKVVEAVEAYYGEGYEVTIRPVQKLNGVTLQGLNIMENGHNACPTIYLESFFEQYEEGTIFSDIFKQIISTYESHKDDEIIDIEHFSNYEEVKKSLSIKLINYELNEDMLDDVPYRLYEDLALVCVVEIPVDKESMGNVLIHNNHICMWGVKSEQLFEDAIENANSNDTVFVKKLTDTIMDLYTEEDDESEVNAIAGNTSDVFEVCRKEPGTLYVLSNAKQINGAAVIVYPNLLQRLAEALNCDFYIVPSSIHEVIILPEIVSGYITNINSMIRTVNADVLSHQEILSEHAYMYSLKDKKLLSVLDVKDEQKYV